MYGRGLKDESDASVGRGLTDSFLEQQKNISWPFLSWNLKFESEQKKSPWKVHVCDSICVSA